VKLNQIRDVLAVAELGSLRAASRQLGISQPVITRSIQDIERDLGVALFERHPKGVRLTDIGQSFIRRARTVDAELRRAREEIEQLKGQTTGQVTAVLSIASSIVLAPAILPSFYKRYPNALLYLSESPFPAVQNDLVDGKLDFFLGAFDQPFNQPHLAVEKLFDNRRVVVARKGHKLVDAASIDALSTARWARLTSRSAPGGGDDWHKAYGLPRPKVVMITGSALLTVLAVAASDLLAIVPYQWLEFPALAERLERVKVIPPMEAPPICLVRHREYPLTPMAEYFCDLVRRRTAHYLRRHPAFD